MKRLEDLTRHATFRGGIIIGAAMLIFGLSSTSPRRVEPLTHAATVIGLSSAPVTAAEHHGPPASTPADAAPAPTLGSAKEVRGASPLEDLKNEPPPRLIVDPPLPGLLAFGVVAIQWRAENIHIVPVYGKGALNVSPRVGHLHVRVDDLPWVWADASNINTVDVAELPPGPHKIQIDLVNPNHEVFPGQSKVVEVTIPKPASHGQ